MGGGVELTPFPPCPLFQTIQIMTGFLHIGFGIVLTTLTNVYTSVFVIGEIPFLGGVSVRAGGLGRDSHRERPPGVGGVAHQEGNLAREQCPQGRESCWGGCQQVGCPLEGMPAGNDALVAPMTSAAGNQGQEGSLCPLCHLWAGLGCLGCPQRQLSPVSPAAVHHLWVPLHRR